MYQRNLSPLASPVTQVNALERCVSIAQDTTKYVSRALYNQTAQETGKTETGKTDTKMITVVARSAVCLHMWRCVLVLCFRGEYDVALVCLHFLRSIGSARKINAACGKSIAFFIERLFERIHQGIGGNNQLEHDEEIIAYLSADTQGSLEHSWVWAGTNMAPSTSVHDVAPGAVRSPGGKEMMRDRRASRAIPSMWWNGSTEWDDWGRVEHMVRQLMDERLHRNTQPPTYYPPPHNPVKRVQVTPDTYSPPKLISNASPAPSNASRISIANII